MLFERKKWLIMIELWENFFFFFVIDNNTVFTLSIGQEWANSVDPGQTLQSVVFELSLLSPYHLAVS